MTAARFGERERPSAGGANVLEASDLTMRFGGVAVLKSVDLSVRPGEIRALVGENGSGKSTLVKILSGYHIPEPGGQVRIAGQAMPLGRPGAGYRLGCRFVHQELGLVESLSVLDNLCLASGFPTRLGTIRMGESRRRACADIGRFGLDVDPDAPVGKLTATARSCVAIARAMREDEAAPAAVLILDEPTAALPEREVDRLIAMLQRVAEQGVAVVYISHRLSEVFRLADSVTVLRDGLEVATEPTSGLDRQRLINLLVGADVEEVSATTPAERTAVPPALRVTGLSADRVVDVSFDAYPGEVLGVAGAAGSGRETVLGAVFGSVAREAGLVEIDGEDVRPNRCDLTIGRGVAHLPADRKALGGFMDLTARENVTLASLQPFWRRWWLRRRGETAEVGNWFQRLDIRPLAGIDAPLSSFSGGNQQKLLLAKWLRLSPRVLMVDEPTQGVDVAARAAVHRHLLDTAGRGTAVVVSSSDAEELAVLSNRVLVFRGSRVIAEIRGADISVAAIAERSHAETESVS